MGELSGKLDRGAEGRRLWREWGRMVWPAGMSHSPCRSRRRRSTRVPREGRQDGRKGTPTFSTPTQRSTKGLQERDQQPNASSRALQGGARAAECETSGSAKLLYGNYLGVAGSWSTKKSGWGIERRPCATNISPPNSAKATAVGRKEKPSRAAPTASGSGSRGAAGRDAGRRDSASSDACSLKTRVALETVRASRAGA
jgi:hypothetical protein